MNSGRRFHKDQSGIAAVWTAIVLLFLLGATALAVDTSEFFQQARSQQRAVDLACLAGAAELPGDPAMAVQKAADFVRPNQRGLMAISPTLPTIKMGNTSTWMTGNFVLEIETPAKYNSTTDPNVLRVSLTQEAPTRFGKVLGADSTGITQEAYCLVSEAAGGPGLLPMGALPGAFSGDLFDCAAKVTGNCGAIDSGSGGNDWRDAVAAGLDVRFQKHHGNWSMLDGGINGTLCSSPFSVPCNAIDTETGNMVGPFNQGMQTRLNPGGVFNDDTLSEVLTGSPGSAIDTLADAFGGPLDATDVFFPSPLASIRGWHSSLYGDWIAVEDDQYYWNSDIAKCDSPRLAAVPIVNWKGGSGVPNHWDIGGAKGTWPNGKKTMKIIGFYTIYIREPDDPGDAGNGNGNGLDQIVADVIWFGPNATCNGVPFGPHGSPPVPTGVTLVAG